MARFNSPLDNIRIASPCSSDWNQMIGDERVRFCQQCSLNVYNLSSMTRREAESLIAKTEGRLCVRYYRRRDGTVLTNNCPVGLRAIKRRISRTASAMLSAVLSFFAGLGLYAGTVREEPRAYSNTMGATALPAENALTNSNEKRLDVVTGTFAYEKVGQIAVPTNQNYRTGRKVSKAIRR
ncbi:MAG TPA: hypothetical protein VGC66_11160 [Pyrinomonadaceae bacterium]|jgi:hypothetical protein